MPAAPLPPNESERLDALRQARLLDTPPEPFFEDIVSQVREHLGSPIVLISLVDESRQWFKACYGLAATETDRDSAFCAHAILDDTPLVVADAFADPRFASNPLVLGAPYVRAYAGAPIELCSGMRLGTVCAIDHRVRHWNPAEIEFLARSARLTARYVETRLAADALAESERAFRLIAESTRDIIIRYATDTTLTYVSPASHAILGYTPDELMGRRIQDIIHPDDLPGAAKQLAAVARAGPDGPPFPMRMRARTKNGDWRWMEGVPRVSVGDNGQLTYYDVNRDVTAQQEMEIELVAARERAEAAAAAKSAFLANMSHELRTPLNSVTGFARLLAASKDLNPRDRRFAALIEASSRATLAIVNDVLDYAAIENGAIALRRAPFSLRELVAGVGDIMTSLADAKGLSLGVVVDRTIAERHVGDGDRLHQILINLVSNAVKFTEVGGVEIFVTSFSEAPGEQTVSIAVRDSGIGVPSDRHEAVFERFVRLADNQRGADGSGLGLSIAKGLVEAMGGTIALDSQVGQGSTFTITLTLRVAAAAAADAAPLPEPVEPVEPKRILVVDDVDLNRELAQIMLENAGHSVETASDGAAAIAASVEDKFDIILMDVQMPGMDGLAATRGIRAGGGASAQVPILALTAGALPEQVASYLLAGMNGHLLKPLLDDDLVRAVAAWTKAYAPTPAQDEATGRVIDELKQRFAARLVEDRSALREALRVNPERPQIRTLVHRLAGSAGSFGFAGIGELACVLDEILALGQTPAAAEIMALLSAMDDAIGQGQARPAA